MYNLKLRMVLSPSNRPHPLHAPVLEVLDLVDPHNPVFSGVGFLQHIQLKILKNRKLKSPFIDCCLYLIANLSIADSVIATWFACKSHVNVM